MLNKQVYYSRNGNKKYHIEGDLVLIFKTSTSSYLKSIPLKEFETYIQLKTVI